MLLDGGAPRHTSPHLATPRHISPHLATPPHTLSHLATSRHISPHLPPPLSQASPRLLDVGAPPTQHDGAVSSVSIEPDPTPAPSPSPHPSPHPNPTAILTPTLTVTLAYISVYLPTSPQPGEPGPGCAAPHALGAAGRSREIQRDTLRVITSSLTRSLGNPNPNQVLPGDLDLELTQSWLGEILQERGGGGRDVPDEARATADPTGSPERRA